MHNNGRGTIAHGFSRIFTDFSFFRLAFIKNFTSLKNLMF
jgi:hypothetical protein